MQKYLPLHFFHAARDAQYSVWLNDVLLGWYNFGCETSSHKVGPYDRYK